MNKYQEALDRIETISSEDIGEVLVGEIFTSEIKTLQELVDKATPKYISCKGFKGMNYTRFYCPTCGKMLEFAEFGFCKHCGQALKYPSLVEVNEKFQYVYEKEGETDE